MYKNKFRKIARDVILSEIESLKKLRTSIDKNFYKVVETIINCKKGKIILSGVGKSGSPAVSLTISWPFATISRTRAEAIWLGEALNRLMRGANFMLRFL